MNDANVGKLITAIQDPDAKVRSAAWMAAGPYGAAAVKPLAEVMTDDRLEIARAAQRGLWTIVRHVGRPGADQERRQVEGALCGLLGSDWSDTVRRDVLWMLSEIGGDDAVQAIRDIPDILEQTGIRDDARCAVERIPGDFAVQTLTEALELAPEDFKSSIVQSLRARGVKVSEQAYPCRKLVPSKETELGHARQGTG